ncbi:MAG: parvulin-like peptidyl-prolyl isomerase [Cryomorphaceae bacterium]|jgi:parvulin-like peptidyl-prolyl isomerase
MAAIGKIREQSTLLLIVIGGAMVAFVLGDLVSSGGVSPAEQYVGEVFGEEIDMLEYEQRVEAQEQSMASIGQPVSTAQKQQIRNQVWNDMIQEKVMYRELNKLGMRIGQDEYDDIRFGENVSEEFANGENFKDPETGQFDPQLVQNYFSFLQEQYPIFYENQTNRLVNERLYAKYNNIVRGGIHVNTLDAKDEYYRQKQNVRFNYVLKAYSSVADSLVDVSDAELKTYYDEHKDEESFKRDASVDLSYVVFDVLPTAEDEENIKTELTSFINEFQKTEKDSLFVLKYSDSRQAVAQNIDATGNDELAAMIGSAEEGSVVGPYKMGNRYAIAKITEIGTEDRATARHILLSNQGGQSMDELKERADSLKRVIQRQNNFEEMVTEFSEDPGSIPNGGKYEDFNRQRMVAEFTTASFDKPIGSLNIVETTYGVHLVEPLEQTEAKVVKGMVVDATIEPSNETFNKVYDEANEFSISAKDLSLMEEMANERGLEIKEAKEVGALSRNIPGVAGSQDAVRWAHNQEGTQVGTLSEPFEFNSKIVVVGLVDRRESGIASLEDVKEEIKPEVILEKKVVMFKAEMNGKTVEDLAALEEYTVKTASNVSEKKPSLPGGASEPYIVGYAISMTNVGDVSEPIQGNKGVYVIQLEGKDSVEPREEYLTFQDELQENRASQMKTYTTGVYRALKDMADVKDDRAKSSR